MRSAGRTPFADWIVLTVRWLFLVSAVIWLGVDNNFTIPLIILIALVIVGNIVATAMVVLSRRDQVFRIVCVAGDTLTALLLFYFSNLLNGGLIWVDFLPLITAAIYFLWIGVFLVTLINFGCFLGLVIQAGNPVNEALLLGLMILAMHLVVGMPLAYYAQFLHRGFRWSRGSHLRPLTETEIKEQEHRRAIYSLISALSSSLNYHKVVETALDLSMRTLEELDAPVDRLVSAILLYSESINQPPELRVAASRRLLPTDRSVVLLGTRGLIGEVIEGGPSGFITDPKNDPELGRLAALHECRSAYVLALRSGLEAYGIIIFGHPESEFFDPDRREVLDIVGSQSVIAIQNARLYRDLEFEKNRIMEIQEESRKKLARDLHDGPTQSVSAIAMRVNFARRLLERDPSLASEELFKIEDLARRTTKEIRHMLFTLRPLVLESQGLAAALESMAGKLKETFDQEVIVQVDPSLVDKLETGKQAVVFFLAEEAVNNARKHAKANHIWVRMKMLRSGLSLLEIEDDGVGFDVNEVGATYESRGSLGMINLRERTDLLNGVLNIDSVKGRGTRVQVMIPLTEEAADRLHRRK
jgi:signal transduction histidine kinase